MEPVCAILDCVTALTFALLQLSVEELTLGIRPGCGEGLLQTPSLGSQAAPPCTVPARPE